MTAVAAGAWGWRDELRDQVRAFSGALLFGIPLLYTLEVWWIASHTSPQQMAAVLAFTFVVAALLIHLAGFRDARDVSLRSTLMDAVEAVAIGMLASLLILVVVREIGPQTTRREVLGKVIYHGVTASIGVALASQFFQGSADGAGGEESGGQSDLLGTIIDLGASAIGAVFVVSAIAPTDEVPLLAGASSPGWLLVVMATSLLASYAIVFVSGFANERKRRLQPGVLQHPVTETVAAYVVALGVCAAGLIIFQRVDPSDPMSVWLPQVVLLGLPGAIGGAAGRLAV
ncbi:MAG: TIGR02587 family membrane protein [Mycobacteriales bacterium]